MELAPAPDRAGTLTPRQIAWVTTVDAEGAVNLAPFSTFNLVRDDPAVVVFAIADEMLTGGHLDLDRPQ